jgi:hypothetical protein
MKKILPLLFIFCFSTIAQAQESVRQKELGLLFRSFDNFGIGFKTGTSRALWRFNTLALNGYSTNEENDGSKKELDGHGFDFRFGREGRKEIAKNVEIRYGGDIFFGYHNSKSKYTDDADPDAVNYTKRVTYTPGVSFVFGFNYIINNSIVIGAEVLPGISYSTGKNHHQYSFSQDEEVDDISGFSYGISNSSALLSLSYRF